MIPGRILTVHGIAFVMKKHSQLRKIVEMALATKEKYWI